MVDAKEAPEGFYAVSKSDVSKSDVNTTNFCTKCDARKLCCENKDNWCMKNRCMSGEVISKIDGKTYSRKDKESVVFKLIDKLF